MKSKIVLASFLIACSLLLVDANPIKGFVDDGVYGAIHIILKNQHPGEDELTQCMVDDFRRNRIADRIYTTDILFNQDKLKREMEQFENLAEFKCTLIIFFQTPIGIAVMVLLFLLAISIICGLIRRCCCC